MLQALPDLSCPLAGVPGTAYRGFGRDGLVVAVPDRLTLEAEPDGRPRLLLTLIRGGGVATSTGGRLELGLSIEADLAGIGRVLAARAASEPGKLQLLSVQNVPSGHERIDFAVPAIVVVEQTISIDPLSTARSMRHGAIDDVVKRLEIPPVPTGRQRLALAANLPEPIAGLQALVADFRAPELLPFRPLAVAVSVSLEAPERRAVAELRLAPGEQLAGEVRLRAVVARNGQAVEIAGPWRAMQRADVLLGPADFGAPLIVLRVSPALTALAVVEAIAAGTVVARLDTATRMTAIPLTEQGLRLLARPLAEGRDIDIELGGKKRLDLDVATLPGFGAHRAQLVTADATPFIVEWQADGETGQEPLSIRLGADRAVADIGWIAASLFRPGVIWRAVRDGTPGPWSAPVLPQDGLVIRIGGTIPMDDHEEPLVIDGIKIVAKNGDRRVWSYMPPHPSLERGPGGAPMLTVIEAGATAFLQCTARVALYEEARTALLARLQEIEPQAERLEAAPLSVERVALEVKTGSTWVAVAESKSSGMPPWTAALAATLAPDSLAAIKSALAGEQERARLRAWIVLPGSSATFRRSAAAGEVRVETPTGTASARFTATADASSPAGTATALELSADIADFFPTGESNR
jgi:hypothetical protein